MAAVLIAAGAKNLTLPSLVEAIAEFDAALLAEPKVIDRDRAELLNALGVGRG